MKRVQAFVLLFTLIGALSLSGCGGRKAADSGELLMWLVGTEGKAKTINKLGDEFFEKTGIRVRCEAISWGEAHSKYLTSIVGEVAPDIGTMGLTWGAEFGNLGAMVNLAEAFPEDVEEMKARIFPGIWRSAEYDGKVYGIPFDLTEHIMYYRKDIVRRPPQTWEELAETLIELKKEDRGMIFEWGSMNWIGFAPFLWQAGGEFYNQEAGRSQLDSPEAADGLKFFGELYTKYGVPKTMIPVEQGMRTGDFPIAISGNWKISGLTLGAPEIDGKWDIALLPKGPTGARTTFIGGRVMGVFKQSGNKEKAWQFIKFLFDPEIQVKIYKDAENTHDTYLPPNMDSWDLLPMKDSFKKILRAQAMDAKGPPPVLGWDASTRYIDEAIQRVVLEKADPASELSKAARSVNFEIK